jgi:hypothetical protein
MCDCGEPAALVRGPRAKGGFFEAYRCAKGAGFIGTAFHWTDVLVVAAWGVAGLALALRFFSWEPAGADRRPAAAARGRSPGAHRWQRPSGHYRPGAGRLGW